MSSTPARSSPQAEAPAASVNEAVCNVFRCWVNPAIFSPRLDFAVREWARRSAHVRKALDRSDRVRTEALKALFVRFGYEDEDAFVRARVLYYMQIGYYALDLREPIEARLNLTPHYLKAFTGVDPSKAEIDAFRAYAMTPCACPGFRAFARAVMSGRYSAFALVRQGFAGHKGWPQAWRKAKPKPAYDFVIVGGGGHGLATAYYLAKTHKRTRVCVIEKGWLGGGNTGRNTTIVRSNYFYPESVALYDLALRLYEGLSRELNFNVMLSQRGILNLAHTPAQLEIAARLANAMQLNGVDAELWGPNEVREKLPLMTQSLDSRYLPNGGVWQRRGGIARHDAVAWGYARAADRLGVDIVENCEATGFIMQNGACVGVETTLGEIRAEAVGVAVAGHSSQLMAKAGVKLPIHSYTLQAMVSEPVKPCLDIVVLHLGTGVYASQSDKGEIVFGGGLDRIPSYGQRGSPPMQETRHRRPCSRCSRPSAN